jgi:hypothetical protein
MNTQQKIDAAGRLSLQANKAWSSENRELLAYVVEDQETFWKCLGSWIKLEARTELETGEPSFEFYIGILRRAFLTLLDENVIHLADPISALAQKALDAMKTASLLRRYRSESAPVVTKSAEELYEEELINLWTSLPSEQFRARLNADRRMRQVWQKLAETDRVATRPQQTKSDEQLEQEVIADFRHLPGKEFQAKRRNSPAYDAMYVKLANENRISL